MDNRDDFKTLRERIARNGLRESLALDKKKRPIDGRSRFSACCQAGEVPGDITRNDGSE